MESQTVSEEEYRLDCLARYLIRRIRTIPPGDKREARFQELLGRKHPDEFKNAMRGRVRRLWQATNDADRAAAQQRKGQRT